MRRFLIAALVVAGLAGSARGQSAIPEKIGFQGRLTNASGNPVDGTVNLTFKLYTTGGTEKWSSGQLGVTVTGGLYSVELGDASLGSLPFDEAYRLGVTVESDAEMTPRYPLLAVPYAMRAKQANDADTLDGLHAADLSISDHKHTGTYVRIDGDTMTGALALPADGLVAGGTQLVLAGDKVGIGTAVPGAMLDVNAETVATGISAVTTSTSGRGLYGYASSATGPTYGAYGVSSSTSGTGVYAMANAGSGTTYGLFARSDSTSGYGIYGAATASSGTTFGVFGSAASPTGWGLYTPNNAHVGGTLSITGGVSLPATGITGAGAGSGLDADTLDGSHASAFAAASGSGNYVQNQTASDQAAGFRITGNGIFNGGLVGIGKTSPAAKLDVDAGPLSTGVSVVTTSTSGRGLYGYASAATGMTYGVKGESNSTSGFGVSGYAGATTGMAIGAYGQTQSESGHGVHGLAQSTTGTTYGVYGDSWSTDGRGVYGAAIATSGTTYGVHGYSISTSGTGVYGHAGAGSGTTFGVLGMSDSPDGMGVYGVANATSGTNFGVRGASASTSGFGVFGRAEATSGITYGVYGECWSASGYAGYFSGNAHVTGTATFQGSVQLDQADSNNGALSPGLKFGTGGVGEGIASKRTGGGNQYGLDFYTRSNVRMSITNDGKVGIGRTPSANKLEVEGDASKATAGSWLANSDARIKEDVATVQNALDVVDRLRPVQFRYTDAYRARHPSIPDVTYYNFIAQEFREVFPDCVKESGEDGILQVDTYPALICSVAAVKELRAQVTALEARLAALERAAGK